MSLRTLLALAFGLLVLYGMFTVGLPFLLALIAAICLEPVTLLLMKRERMSRLVAGTLVSTAFTFVTVVLMYWIGFKVVREVVDFWNRAPAYLEEATRYLDAALERTKLIYESLSPEMAMRIQMWLDQAADELPKTVAEAVKSVSGYLAGTIPNAFIFYLVFIIAVYLFAYSLPSLKLSLLQLFEERSRDKVAEVLVGLRRAFIGFLQSQFILAVITYVVTFFGLLLLRTEYPLAISLLVTVMEFAPVIGTGLVFIPWALYQFIIGNIGYGFGLVILFVVGATLRRIIEPKILSDTVGISALAALASLYIGYELIGLVGMFVGPTAVILYQTLRKAGLFQLNFKLDE